MALPPDIVVASCCMQLTYVFHFKFERPMEQFSGAENRFLSRLIGKQKAFVPSLGLCPVVLYSNCFDVISTVIKAYLERCILMFCSCYLYYFDPLMAFTHYFIYRGLCRENVSSIDHDFSELCYKEVWCACSKVVMLNLETRNNHKVKCN